MRIRTVNPSRNGDERINMPLKQCFGKAIPVGRTRVGTQYVKRENVNVFRQKDVYFCCHEGSRKQHALSSLWQPEPDFLQSKPIADTKWKCQYTHLVYGLGK